MCIKLFYTCVQIALFTIWLQYIEKICTLLGMKKSEDFSTLYECQIWLISLCGLCFPRAVCQRKWRDLRDEYHNQRLAERGQNSGLAAEQKRKGRFKPLLCLLDPWVLEKPSSFNMSVWSSLELDGESCIVGDATSGQAICLEQQPITAAGERTGLMTNTDGLFTSRTAGMGMRPCMRLHSETGFLLPM